MNSLIKKMSFVISLVIPTGGVHLEGGSNFWVFLDGTLTGEYASDGSA